MRTPPEAAVKDFTHAAELGDAYAQDMLGRMFLVGDSVLQDREKAIEWLKKAAEQGYEPAEELLPVAMNNNCSFTSAGKPAVLVGTCRNS